MEYIIRELREGFHRLVTFTHENVKEERIIYTLK